MENTVNIIFISIIIILIIIGLVVYNTKKETNGIDKNEYFNNNICKREELPKENIIDKDEIINLNIETIDGDNKVENFIVSDAQDIHNYRDYRNDILHLKNYFDKEDLDNPSKERTLDYDQDYGDSGDFSVMVVHGKPPVKKDLNKQAYLSSTDFGWDSPRQFVSCSNGSINDIFTGGPKKLLPNQLSCKSPNKLTAENYYKTVYEKQIIPIEDQLIRGYNYQTYSNFMNPYQIRYDRILSQNTKGLPSSETVYKNLPAGFNYAFHNTPVMKMP